MRKCLIIGTLERVSVVIFLHLSRTSLLFPASSEDFKQAHCPNGAAYCIAECLSKTGKSPMLSKSDRRLFIPFQLKFVLNKVNVTHLHTAFSANAEPLWEKNGCNKGCAEVTPVNAVYEPKDRFFKC